MKIDLHCHTHWSSDSRTSVVDLLETYKKRGIDCAAITDHNEIGGAIEGRQLGIIPVIIGEEVMTTQGEIIGLFLTERIPRGLSPLDTVDAIHSQGGIVLAPHPTDRFRGSALQPSALADLSPHLDMVEIFNGRTILSSDNDTASKFQQSSQAVACVGSDAHTLSEIGSCYNEIENFTDAEDFLSKMAVARLIMARSPLRVHLYSTVAKLLDRLNQGK